MNIKNGFYFLPLGGANEIGMNFNLYCYNGKWIIVDLGVTFGAPPWREVVVGDPSFIVENKKDLLAIVLTHAHEDHIGAVPYLWEQLQVPVYATAFTINLLKEKLYEFGLLDEVPLIEVPLSSSITIGPFDIEFINMTHSIPEPNTFAIRTPLGTVIHTGDWKFDETPPIGHVSDKLRLKEYGQESVLACVCDSTNVFVNESTGSEQDVRNNLIDLVGRYQGRRVIVACFASNITRLESCAVAAKAHGRSIAISGRSLVRMEKVARLSGYLQNIADFIDVSEASSLPQANLLWVCTGSQAEHNASLTKAMNGENPFLTISPGDVVIFSSRDIPGNEKYINKMQNDLARMGVEVITNRQIKVHVSGHPSKAELQEMYSLIKPQLVIPVHGGGYNALEHAKIAKACGVPMTLTPSDGQLIKLAPGVPTIIGSVKHGRLAIDGHDHIPADGSIKEERIALGVCGAMFVTASANGFVRVSSTGVFDSRVHQLKKRAILELIKTKALQILSKNLHKSAEFLAKKIEYMIKFIMKEQRGIVPYLVVHVMISSRTHIKNNT